MMKAKDHHHQLAIFPSAGPIYQLQLQVHPQHHQHQHQHQQHHHHVVRPTRKRYLILFLFTLLNVMKSFQWICLASVTNVVANYYQVSNLAINWTCIVFMVTFLVLALPVSWIMEYIGLRQSILIGAVGTTLGAIIKCFSCHPNGFHLSMLGHLLIGLAEPFFFSAYSKIAAVWFPDNEVSLATSVAAMGETIGLALGFILPGLLLGSDPADSLQIQRGLFHMFLAVSAVMVANTLGIVGFFDEEPPQAPGLARFKQLEQQLEHHNHPPNQRHFLAHLARQVKLLRKFMLDANFCCLLIQFGLNVGTNYSIHTLLNQMLLVQPAAAGAAEQQQQQQQQSGHHSGVVGNAGLLLILIGLLGSFGAGLLLDRFHRYKPTTLLVYLATFLSMCLLAGLLALDGHHQPSSPWALYLAILPLGLFTAAYSCCGFDYAVELTYPKPELVSSTLLNVSAQLFGIPISLLGSTIVDRHGPLALALFFAALLLAGLLFAALQGGPLKRQQAVAAIAANDSPNDINQIKPTALGAAL